MISFEWYVARAKINLDSFFKSQDIKSDEELKAYCELKLMIPPNKSYFEINEAVETEATISDVPVQPAIKVKTIRSKTTKSKPKTTKSKRRNTRTNKK